MELEDVRAVAHHPVMTLELFASRSGLSVPSVRAMIHNGDLPSIKIGKRRLVNVVRLVAELAAEEGEE